jgi:hypothetical protein
MHWKLNALKQKFHAHETQVKIFGLKRKKRFQNFSNSLKSAVTILQLLKDLLFVLAKIQMEDLVDSVLDANHVCLTNGVWEKLRDSTCHDLIPRAAVKL